MPKANRALRNRATLYSSQAEVLATTLQSMRDVSKSIDEIEEKNKRKTRSKEHCDPNNITTMSDSSSSTSSSSNRINTRDDAFDDAERRAATATHFNSCCLCIATANAQW
jgi:hypothetical protein